MLKLQIAQSSVPEGVIDLGIGQPQVDLLPLEDLKLAMEHQLKRGNPEILQYGLAQGDANFRSALAEFLGQAYGAVVDGEELLATAGKHWPPVAAACHH